MAEHVVAGADELGEGERRVVTVDGLEIGVFRVDGDYVAYLNRCPHQQGPVCEGPLTGRQREAFDRETLETALSWSDDDRVLVCPWHSWSFDVQTGELLPERELSLPSFPTRVEDGQVLVEV